MLILCFLFNYKKKCLQKIESMEKTAVRKDSEKLRFANSNLKSSLVSVSFLRNKSILKEL